ncbi:MAG: molybdopterin-dependent oxidoreductase [Flexilinea sp.]
MEINFTLNGKQISCEVEPHDTLLDVLRYQGCYSVKRACYTGECGNCAALMDGKLLPTCVMPAMQAEGHRIVTVEGLSEGQDLHPIQKAFVETGAVQCGFCTPGMILAAKALLDRTKYPSLEEAKDALGAILCRCTGYYQPLDAVMRAAAYLRGEEVPPYTRADEAVIIDKKTTESFSWIGKSVNKIDAPKMAKGRPVYVDDIEIPGMLHGMLMTSPYAHARIRNIDTTQAEALPGVHCVLTYKNVKRQIYASGGQTYPNPKPWDQVSLDNKVRFVGDRVAIVAADSVELCHKAICLIKVDWEVLPAVFDMEDTMKDGAPVIHDEQDAVGVADASHNKAFVIDANYGDLEKDFAESDLVVERVFQTQQVQQTPLEPHIVITYWDEDDRLVVRTSTQVPFHVRRVISPLIDVPIKNIRVIKPRIGGGFGAKQEVLIEDLCSLLTVRTGRPVRFYFSRKNEFQSSRSRHSDKIRFKIGVTKSGRIKAIEMDMIENTGAYGVHGFTVCNVTGTRGLSTYRADSMRFHADIVYTNLPVPGAFRGYGGPQGIYSLECIMDEVAEKLKMDPIKFRMKNVVRPGENIKIMEKLAEFDPVPQRVNSFGLDECIEQAKKAIDWDRRKYKRFHIDPDRPNIRKGLGMAIMMHGSGIAGIDMGAASMKINDDGSFNLQMGATDLGTGSDTILAQIAAEVLKIPLDKIIVYSSDTDFTPFDVGAYASSTTYISGMAVMKCAEKIKEQVLERASAMLKQPVDTLILDDENVTGPDGLAVTMEEIALNSLHRTNQQQIAAHASHFSPECPPVFATEFAEVEVDTDTGQVNVIKLVMAVNPGTVINPITAIGQLEGGQATALGYAVCEEMCYDDKGDMVNPRFGDYHILQADEMPEMISIIIPQGEKTGPFGAKALAEIPTDGVAPAVANAVADAIGVRINSLPIVPDKVWLELKNKDLNS